MVPGDMILVIHCITRQADDFHPVHQRLWDRGERVSGCNKHYLREIIAEIKIVVTESVILFRVKYLQQSRSRITAEISAELINFIHHDEGILCAGTFHALDNNSRKSTDIGYSMASYLCLVPDTSKRETNEFTVGCFGY